MKGRKYQQERPFPKIKKYNRSSGKVLELLTPTLNIQFQPSLVVPADQDDLEFEDEFEDEFEEEEAWVSESSGSQAEIDQCLEDWSKHIRERDQNELDQGLEVFLQTNKNIKKGEFMDFENSAYDMLHRLNTEWPSLSVDFVCRDSAFTGNLLPVKMAQYPYEVLTVQGTSSNAGNNNSIYLTKWTKLHKTRYDDDPEADGDDQDKGISNDDEPEAILQQVFTPFNVNRIRTLGNSPVVAYWNDHGEIRIMDLSQSYENLKNDLSSKKKEHLQESIFKSESQGYALAWNPNKIGQLITGNLLGHLEVYQSDSGASWVKATGYQTTQGSIEDVSFSSDENLLLVCYSTGSIQLMDLRIGKPQNILQAHKMDVNVGDWNKFAQHLIATGSEDNTVKIWDIRTFQQGNQTKPLHHLQWHQGPITSLQFQPHNQSGLSVASEDNSVSIWDISMENECNQPQVPNELMFVHQGLKQIKEVCYHPVLIDMMVVTACDGTHLFKPCFQTVEKEYGCSEDLQKPPIREQQIQKALGH